MLEATVNFIQICPNQIAVETISDDHSDPWGNIMGLAFKFEIKLKLL